MGRTTWVYITCEQHFTRRFSANRHNDTFHSGDGVISKLANNLIMEKGFSLPESATSISNSSDKYRYSRMNSYANQPQENNMKIDNVSGKEHTLDIYSQFASMPEPLIKAAERSRYSSTGLLDRYIKIQEIDALLFRLGPPHRTRRTFDWQLSV